MRRFCLIVFAASILTGCWPIRRHYLYPDPAKSPTPVVDRREEGGVVRAVGGNTNSSPVAAIEPLGQPAPIAEPPLSEILDSQIRDAYFPYNWHDLVPEARMALADDAAILKSILTASPNVVLSVEGHCDERGSAEYNLALGDLRAREARDFLVEFGLTARQLDVISFGKERPQCTQPDEACWAKNRRAHLAAK